MLDPPEAFEQYDPESEQQKRDEDFENAVQQLSDILFS